jgi:hypothetical protein
MNVLSALSSYLTTMAIQYYAMLTFRKLNLNMIDSDIISKRFIVSKSLARSDNTINITTGQVDN